MKKLSLYLASDEIYPRVLKWSGIVVSVYAIFLFVVILIDGLNR
jgi:hypothetical protein